MQVERIIVNFNPVFGLRNRRRGLKRFSCFSRKRTDLSKKKVHGVCTLTKVYQYAKEERFLFFEPCRTLVDICMELLLIFEKNICISDLLTMLVCDICYNARKINYFTRKGQFIKSGNFSISQGKSDSFKEVIEVGDIFLHIHRS